MRSTWRRVFVAAGLLALTASLVLLRAEAMPERGAAASARRAPGSGRGDGLAPPAAARGAVQLAGAPSSAAGGATVLAAIARGDEPGAPGAGPAAGGAPGPAGPWRAEKVDVHWALEQARVVSPGKTVTIAADPKTGQPGGLFTDGYVLEGKVRAKRGGVVPEGDLRVTLTAFRPDVDLPGQKAGLWHVQGKWKVVARGADPEALKARHNPYVVEGSIQDALPVNPAEAGGAWSARATVPTSPAAGRWARGKRGTLTLRPGGGGDLEIALALLGGNE